jgi:hypothetical protein
VSGSPKLDWDYDTARFANGQVPGETRYFQLAEAAAGFSVFRWRFFHPEPTKPFSVNLSGVLFYGSASP